MTFLLFTLTYLTRKESKLAEKLSTPLAICPAPGLKTESICDLVRMILTMNNFEFDNNHFIQLHGTAMGTRMAPAYANLFMGDLEEKLLAQFPLKPYLWWRYTDDIFMVWTHGEDKLEDFINHINSLHSTIKFTHEFSKSHISFLDVTVSLDNNNKISTDLFVKSTDTHQYLLHTSCHPSHIKKIYTFQPRFAYSSYLLHH